MLSGKKNIEMVSMGTSGRRENCTCLDHTKKVSCPRTETYKVSLVTSIRPLIRFMTIAQIFTCYLVEHSLAAIIPIYNDSQDNSNDPVSIGLYCLRLVLQRSRLHTGFLYILHDQ